MSAFGLGMENIIKTTIFLTDMANFAIVNEVHETYFVNDKLARSTVAVKGLPRVAKNAPIKVEIETIAYKGL